MVFICVDFPDKAVESTVVHSGPVFNHVLEGETHENVNSFMDILKLPETNTAVPAWRMAYLSGEVSCIEKEVEEDNLFNAAALSLGRNGVFQMYTVCGKELGDALMSFLDVFEKPACSTGMQLLNTYWLDLYVIRSKIYLCLKNVIRGFLEWNFWK